MYLQCIANALGTLAENGCGSRAAVPVHRENWTAMITAHIWPPKGKKQLCFSLSCPPKNWLMYLLSLQAFRTIDTRFARSYKFLLRCDQFENLTGLNMRRGVDAWIPIRVPFNTKLGSELTAQGRFALALLLYMKVTLLPRNGKINFLFWYHTLLQTDVIFNQWRSVFRIGIHTKSYWPTYVCSYSIL